MNTSAPIRKSIPIPALIALVAGIIIAIAAFVYLSHPAPPSQDAAQASQEARAYVGHLQLSDVTMQATENFMNQQVVEVQGKIGNQGTRPLRSVDIFCLFRSVDGHQLKRERVAIVPLKGSPLKPGETRAFRLPFDSTPEGWNQALPTMVIAGITFAE